MSPDRIIEHAERVRSVCLEERKLRKLDDKIDRGHVNLRPFRDQLAAKLNGGAA